MTTTSTFPFSTMEVPAVDDKMEMASPYQGNADDFEIDIDVMEDQASNPDRDMTAADEYIGNSHDELYDNENSPDEDMVDDAAEPSMIDADDYPETHQNFEMQDRGGKSYEEDMLEDEYDEDIDAPVPEHQKEPPTSVYNSDNQNATVDSVINDGDAHTDSTNGPAENLSEPKTLTGKRNKEDYTLSETAHSGHIQGEETDSGTKHYGVDKDPDENLQAVGIKKSGLEPAQTSFDEAKEVELHSHEEQQVLEQLDKGEEQELESAEHQPLHPVKVYYQENEISLFPPREGDSTETFFLEDEAIAYGSLGKLFESCREVLQDHISQNEVLVLDIDCLNIQISEDSRETEKITLKQIVDVFLQLCHNDGTETSDALYLTLSTKLTITAEISDLLLAASEGKGLSEIQPWEIYPEADGNSVEFDETTQAPQDNLDTGDEPAHKGGPSLTDRDVRNSEQVEITAESAETSEATSVATPVNESDTRGNAVIDSESPRHESHDSEERNTESTGTVEPLPANDVPEEQSVAGDAATDLYHGENIEDEYEYHDLEEHEGTAQPAEEGAHVGATELLDSDEGVGSVAAGSPQGHPEEHQDPKSAYHEQHAPEDVAGDDAFQANESVYTDVLQTQGSNNKAMESLPEGSSPTLQIQEVPHLLDHPLGTAEEPLEDARNEPKANDEPDRAGGANEPGELDEIVEHTSTAPANEDEVTDLPFDDEDYLDLGFEEGHDRFDEDNITASPSHVSVKRTRELEDDIDVPETPTPEAKRSRSS